jgi:monothiol glutaredoxin
VCGATHDVHIDPSNEIAKENFMTETTVPGAALAHIVETISTHPVVLFIKGTPARPRCRFSGAVVEALRHYDRPTHAIDVLRQAIKSYSDWPTIPQLYGCDIVQEMHGTGELAALIVGERTEALS